MRPFQVHRVPTSTLWETQISTSDIAIKKNPTTYIYIKIYIKEKRTKEVICLSFQRQNQGKPTLEPKEKAYYNVLCNRDVCNQKGQVIMWQMQLVPTDDK